MFRDKHKKIIACTVALLAFSLSSVTAYADRPHDNYAVKGSSAANGTYIDKSLYVDGSQFENIPHDKDIMKIGLSYGDGAASKAELVNLSGEGFVVGQFDGEGNFSEILRTNESSIIAGIRSDGGCWHILLDEGFEPDEDTDVKLQELGIESLMIDDSTRKVCGSFKSRNEAKKFISRLELEAKPWYDGSGSIYLVDSEDEDLIYKTDEGISRLAVVPMSGNSLTAYDGNRYRGCFEFRMHDAKHLNLINYVGLEDYVKGVIPYEMSYSWPFEALKAQAVCARTYAVYNEGRFEEYGFDLTADTYSQVYRGTLEANEISDSAVDETAGQLVRYKGQPCEIYYCSSNGGATEDGINVFDTGAPYLSGKTDPFEEAVKYPLKDWKLWRDGEEIGYMLREWGYEIGDVVELIPEYSDTDNVIAIKFIDDKENTLEIRGRDCYTSLGLHSCRFSIERDDEDFVFIGKGWGHNCGMSQWGANSMASVYGYNYEDILRFYFSGAYVA